MEHEDYYRALRRRVVAWLESPEGRRFRWAEHLLLAPDLFHLLFRLSLDGAVPLADKGKLAGALAYWISPLDLAPELFLGPAGYLDDVALAAYVLNALLNRTPPEVVRRHWAGDGEALEAVQRIVGAADRMVGAGLWAKLRKLLG